MTQNNFKKTAIGSLFMMIMMLMVGGTSAQAQSQLDAKVYLTYADFVAGRALSVDSLVGGRTRQICQLRQEDYQVRIYTGDKEVDKILKQKALVVEYGGHLYVNCRYLRCNDIPLDVTNYTQALRYDGNKLCVISHWINTGVVLAEMAADITAVVSPLPVAVPAAATAGVLAWNLDKLSNYRCYYLDSDANAKGKTPVVRIDDAFMDKILTDNPDLKERYHALSKKRQRQSAANIIPFLKEKGLVKE